MFPSVQTKVPSLLDYRLKIHKGPETQSHWGLVEIRGGGMAGKGDGEKG